jgi:hypothetical protein
VGLGDVAQIGRHFWRHGEEARLERAAAIERDRCIEWDRAPDRLEQAPRRVVLEDRFAHPMRREDPERQRLAQHEQSEHVVELGRGQRDGVERYVARARLRVQRGKHGELAAQVGTRVDDRPAHAVRRHREARLGPRRHIGVAAPRAHRIVAAAVPLRQSAARTRTEHPDLHCG